jgi:hypothetical protein
MEQDDFKNDMETAKQEALVQRIVVSRIGCLKRVLQEHLKEFERMNFGKTNGPWSLCSDARHGQNPKI